MGWRARAVVPLERSRWSRPYRASVPRGESAQTRAICRSEGAISGGRGLPERSRGPWTTGA